jgi:tetratricopeptide (TPR) repeat protein
MKWAFGVFVLLSALVGAAGSEGEPAAAAGTDSSSGIERHVERAIAFAYLGDAEALEKEYLYFKGMDDFLDARDVPTTGLSDNVLDLSMSTIADPDEFVRAQRSLLGETPDADLRGRIEHRLGDESRSADALLRADRYNRFAFIFNTFVRPLSLLAVGYFPAMIDAGMATALNAGKLTELSVEERKALVLYRRFLDKYPDSDKAELLRRRVTRLDRKRLESARSRELALAQEELAKGNYWQSQQHFKNALAYAPGDDAAAKGLARARELEAELNALKRRTLEPADKAGAFAPGDDERAYARVLYAAADGVPETLILEAEGFLARHPQSPYAPSARYAIAVAHDMKGAHDTAISLMRELAERDTNTHVGRRAAAFLADEGYNPRRAFERSRTQHAKDTARYIALGDGFVKSNLILGTSRFITQGLQALGSMGTFNVLALGIRGASSVLRTPVSEGEIIDRGVAFLRRYPDSPDAPDVHLKLGRAYARRQNLAKAVYHYEKSGKVSEGRLAKLREKAAAQYLEFAEATDSAEEKIRCYETVLDDYPGTAAAPKALERLAVLEKSREPIFSLDKQTLSEDPIVFSLTALHLGPHLLDGDPDNGELSPKGIVSTQRGTITLVHLDGKGEREETVDLDYATYRRLMAFAEEAEYRSGLRGNGGYAGGRIPIELRGTIGDDGVYAYPRLKIREYKEKDLYLYR